jgi:hypothetical protein
LIVAGQFEGDDNKRAMLVQHDMYWRQVGLMVSLARDRLKSAEAATGSQTVLGLIQESNTAVDHRVLQLAHDRLAAHFRWMNEAWLRRGPHESDRVYDLRVAGNWHLFFVQEWMQLLQEPKFLHAVLEAIAFQNSETGYRAEDAVDSALRARYRAWLREPTT